MSLPQIDLGARLGSGGFGAVHECKLGGADCAVKVLRLQPSGIYQPLELAIMSAFTHPNLAAARFIHYDISQGNIYAVQEKALYDFAYLTRKNKQNYRPPPDMLRNTCIALRAALACLHENSLIHCDVKASNVLYFQDKSIRLSDFSLAVRKNSEKSRFKNWCGTTSHMAPEFWRGASWNEKVDIWALGCTLYEIATGDKLFHDPIGKKETRKDEAVKKRQMNVYTKWHSHWLRLTGRTDSGQLAKLGIVGDVSSPDMVLDAKLTDPNLRDFWNFVIPMLALDDFERPSLKDLAEHEYIKDKAVIEFKVRHPKIYPITPQRTSGLKRKARRILDERNIRLPVPDEEVLLEQMIRLYSTCVDGLFKTPEQQFLACMNLAYKITEGESLKFPSDKLEAIVKLEKELVEYLNYHLL